MRREYCVKDGISVTYSEDNVCFEDTKTAEALLIDNDGRILIDNFDPARSAAYVEWHHRIYPTVVWFRTLGRRENAPCPSFPPCIPSPRPL